MTMLLNACMGNVHPTVDIGPTTLASPRFYWDYQMRAPGSQAMRDASWENLWPMSSLLDGGAQGMLNVPCEEQAWEPYVLGDSGNIRPAFFTGQCTDNAANPLGGAVVKAYRTSDDSYAGTCACDDSGHYQCPTFYGAVNHYLVAYYASTGLSGTTLNTLQPDS